MAKPRSDYTLMNARLSGMIAEICARDEIEDGDLSQRIGRGADYLRKKSAGAALPELRLKDVMLIAQMSGRKIKFEEV